MPAMDYQGSSVPFASVGRSILSLRREQGHSVDGHHDPGSSQEQEQEQELDFFQQHVTDLFMNLSSAITADGVASSGGEELLCLPWVRRLLDTFLICQEEFRAILVNNYWLFSRPPLDRLISEFYERSVKALDVCNAIRDGIEQIRQWKRHIEIILVALDPGDKPITQGQIRRAKKALMDLAAAMLDEKESTSVLAQRNRSFGRGSQSSRKDHRAGGYFRSLSWSVSRSWSAARQLQTIGNIYAPRGHEVVATSGLAIPIFTMSSVLHFVMWALVAAIPCQDRGLQTHFSIPRNFSWGNPILSLHDRIVEESKKRERRNSIALLKEIHDIEKCARHLLEPIDSLQFPLTKENEEELRQGAQKLANFCDAIDRELDPLERQVREVFHRIVRSRTEGLDCLNKQE
ncbi:hypothetical protein AXF42_Ash011678 [Apostasia shenzhenica]|uniref:Uncharacterized protein n=1 Tax=Apostasia shenzhenica TaxID=1088818 RepID=A0A2H9ZUN6_9ASPA|nr:hypothetical protein AXF42_Ash011678 [Apostasia shenzhenica]